MEKLMNDLKFAAVIKDGAITAGLRKEELVNYLSRLFQNPPKEFAHKSKDS